jgi:hypothetical protein
MVSVAAVVMKAVEATIQAMVAENRAVEMVREKDAEVVEAAVTVARAAPTEATIQAMVEADLAAKAATVVKMASVVLVVAVVAKAHLRTEADLLPMAAMAPDQKVASDWKMAREALLRTVATAAMAPDRSVPEARADVMASRDPMMWMRTPSERSTAVIANAMMAKSPSKSGRITSRSSLASIKTTRRSSPSLPSGTSPRPTSISSTSSLSNSAWTRLSRVSSLVTISSLLLTRTESC